MADKEITCNKEFIELDGIEGGGQILRTALSLSTITNKPFKIINIRKKRSDPGLKPQHLIGIEVLKKITGAKCNAKLGDTELEFEPGKCNSTKEDIDIQTAGSITLLLQCIMPVLICSKKISNLKIKGGTDVSWSPSMDYFKEVIISALRQFADIELKILKRGFYPKGQGEIEIKIKPKKEISKINKTERGKLIQITGNTVSSYEFEPKKISERVKDIENMYLKEISCSKNLTSAYARTESTGVITALTAQYENVSIGSDKLEEKTISSEELGKECAKKLIERMNHIGCCDEHLADNLIPYIALFGGEITTGFVTEHIKTCVDTANMFFDDKKIVIEEKENFVKLKLIEIN